MKKFIFGLIVLVVMASLVLSLPGEKDMDYAEPQIKNSFKMVSDIHSLRSVAEMIWELGTGNSVDIDDRNAMNRWQEQCEQAMIQCYDSIHPDDSISDYQKVKSVLDDLGSIIPEGITTIEMMNHSMMVYCVLMYKVVAYSKIVLQRDSTFKDEMKAWDELYVLLSNFCIGVIYSEWFGDSCCGPMIEAVRNNVLEVRVKDLHRIIQLEGGSDPATDQMVTLKRNELNQAMERALKTVDKADVYKSTKKSKAAIPAALEKWYLTRAKYKGCTAVTIDEMKDAVNYSCLDSPKTISPE